VCGGGEDGGMRELRGCWDGDAETHCAREGEQRQ